MDLKGHFRWGGRTVRWRTVQLRDFCVSEVERCVCSRPLCRVDLLR